MDFPAYDAILAAPFANLGVCFNDAALTRLDFLPPQTPLRPSGLGAVKRLRHELEAYYADPAHAWDLILAPAGTPFRQRVWQALAAIPAGQTRTYGEIAAALASSPRAVGQAVGDNPIPIIIPCHRVLAADGIGGFMHGREGFPLTVKQWLLRHEGVAL
jgi:methylated-DNA-[protein]-cysteine S-methyltransferase